MHTEIFGWNPINVDKYENPQVSLYIKPTLKLLELFNRAVNNQVLVLIHDTGSCYDGKKIFATLDKSSDVPNCRQNFFNCTGLYVATIDHVWSGYPLNNGKIEFLEGSVDKIIEYVKDDSKDPDDIDKILNEPIKDTKKIRESVNNDNSSKSRGFTKTILIIIGIALFSILVFSIFKKK